MKQKEVWADAFWQKHQDDGCYDNSACAYRTGWLVGFEFARQRCADAVCSCCDNPNECLDIGEKDIDKPKRKMEPAPFSQGSGPSFPEDYPDGWPKKKD